MSLTMAGATVIGAGIAATSAAGQMGVNHITGHKSRKLARQLQQRSFEFEREQREYNYQKYLEALEYDRPENQYQRYLDAGLNPAYYMGENSSQPIATQNVPQDNSASPYEYIPDSYRNPDLSSFGAIGAQLTKDLTQYNIQKKELELKERGMYKNEELIDARLKLMEKQNLLTTTQVEDLQSQIDTRVSQVELYRYSAAFQKEQARHQGIINDSMSERIRLEFKEKKATINQLISQYHMNFKTADFIAKQIRALNLEMYSKTFDAKVYQELLVNKAYEIAASNQRGDIDLHDAELPGLIKSAEQKSSGWYVTISNVLDLLGKFTGVVGNVYQFRGVNSNSQTMGNFNSSNRNQNYNFNMNNNNGSTTWVNR